MELLKKASKYNAIKMYVKYYDGILKSDDGELRNWIKHVHSYYQPESTSNSQFKVKKKISGAAKRMNVGNVMTFNLQCASVSMILNHLHIHNINNNYYFILDLFVLRIR